MLTRSIRVLEKKSILRAEKHVNNLSFNCLFSGCKEKAIRSHSQQKERQLRSIAVDGHIYTLTPSFTQYFKMKTAYDPLEISRVGITKASTYLGFCSKHDSELFMTIETGDVDPENAEHRTLLFLRALSYEYCMKRKVYSFQKKRREIISNELHWIDPDVMELGFKVWISNIWQILYSRLLSIIQSGAHNGLRSIFQEIGWNIDVSCCGVVDIRGQTLQELQGVKNIQTMSPLYAFNIIPRSNKSYVIITSFAEHSLEVNRYIGPLENEVNLERIVNKLAFYDCEDSCISPRIWESLCDDEKKNVQLSIRHPNYRENFSVPNIIKLIRNDSSL